MTLLSSRLVPALAALLAALALSSAAAALPEPEGADFVGCSGPGRITCVVDGDTFWYQGRKIRIADINAPEVSHPACAREAALGAAATSRLTQLLNAGPFSLAIEGREIDRYGRALRVVLRRGVSLGAQLEREGLAEHWHGRRGDWCAV